MCGGREEGEGGGGGGHTAAAAAAASPWRQPRAPRLPGPPLQQRRGPPGPGPAAAAAALEGDAPGVFIFGRSPRRAARGALQRPGPGAKQAARGRRRLLAGAGGRRGSARGWLGSGPRSARGRLPLPPAPSSSELHQRPSPAPRATWLKACRDGAAAAPGTLAPDCAPRLRRARLLQTPAALGAGLPPRGAGAAGAAAPPPSRPARPASRSPSSRPGAGSAWRGRSPWAQHRQLSLSPSPQPGAPALGPQAAFLADGRGGNCNAPSPPRTCGFQYCAEAGKGH